MRVRNKLCSTPARGKYRSPQRESVRLFVEDRLMAKLKSERHHWWPACVSRHWAADDGKTGWLKPDGSTVRIPPARLGVIGNGHHIKLGRNDEDTVWDQSFERVFDKADDAFPDLIRWLEGLERRPVREVRELRQRFIPQPCTDAELARMTECAVSLAVRGPMNREASVALAEDLRGPLPTTERNALIGLNMRNSHRLIADSIGSRGKFVAVYSQRREFVFGDGFFHNVKNVQNPPSSPKLFVPITPHICILVCRPSRYREDPKLTTLMLDDHEVDICNKTVQVYAEKAIFFRSQQPVLTEEFKRGKHLQYAHPANPIDGLIHSIPGVPARDTSLDHIFHPEGG
ncbi:hypothetical protein DBR42_03730 [Pelomonas sp. HMWF004]|nr:hypothetical protein DBR42_03730 [Pelomonas sp. HMWF004]